jgi:glycosyltransferase involved in cell wall biosynthesis
VHTHNSKAGFLGRIAAKISGTPVIVHTIHGFSFHSCEIPLRRRVFMILERFAANFTDKLISVSVPMKNWGLSLGIGRTKQYCVIPSGIEIEKFDINLDLSGLRKEFGFGADDLVVGAVAKLWKGKGHSTIIKSAPLVIQEVPKVKFIFIGEGYLRRNLEKDIAKRKLSGYFQFAGFRSDIPQVTGLLDVALLVSSFEGLGRVILEAMASRKPVVASNVGGITDIVQDGINGFLVQPNHPETLARVLIKLLKDSALRRRLGENGRRKVEEGFRAERTLNDTETIYQELLREKKIR